MFLPKPNKANYFEKQRCLNYNQGSIFNNQLQQKSEHPSLVRLIYIYALIFDNWFDPPPGMDDISLAQICWRILHVIIFSCSLLEGFCCIFHLNTIFCCVLLENPSPAKLLESGSFLFSIYLGIQTCIHGAMCKRLAVLCWLVSNGFLLGRLP